MLGKLAAIVAVLAAAEPASAGNFALLHTFSGADGAGPAASLVARGAILYGTTFIGGKANYGTVFSVNTKTGAVKVVYSFNGGTDAASPLAALTPSGDLLYGVTTYGGASGNGTVFSLNLKTHAEQVVYAFAGGHLGAHPQATLLKIGGFLYGTTTNGGADGFGTLFKVNATTGHAKVLYSFHGGSDGAYPFTGLIDIGGTLYSATSGGGDASCTPNGCGTVYSFDLATGSEKVVYSFHGGGDGERPYADLINAGGLLYGTTVDGGGGSVCGLGCGTVYSLNPATGAETVVYAFQNTGDGANPFGLINTGGVLYGITQVGGGQSFGSVYTLNPATAALTTLYSFTGGSDGANPYGGLAAAGGLLYGTTEAGGAAHDGTVFAVTP